MKVDVKIHTSVGADYADWIRRNSKPPTGDPVIARAMEDELRSELIRSSGKPIAAICNASDPTPYWVWSFNSNTWIRYVIKDRASGLFGGQTRRVVITAISDTPLS